MSREQSNPFPDEVLERMVQLLRQLGTTQAEIEALLRPPRPQRTLSGFPFSVLERILRAGLAALERTVTRFVRALVR